MVKSQIMQVIVVILSDGTETSHGIQGDPRTEGATACSRLESGLKFRGGVLINHKLTITQSGVRPPERMPTDVRWELRRRRRARGVGERSAATTGTGIHWYSGKPESCPPKRPPKRIPTVREGKWARPSFCSPHLRRGMYVLQKRYLLCDGTVYEQPPCPENDQRGVKNPERGNGT